MSALAGRRILVVEDEPIIAFAVEDMLASLGCTVVGPAMTLEEALDLATEEPIDAAIVDVNLNGARSFPVADILADRSIPFVFATGYDDNTGHWGGDAPLIAKPYRLETVADALGQLVG